MSGLASRTPLAAKLETDFEPGSNLRGRLSFADERYLLPDLRTGSFLHLGLPKGLDVGTFARRLEPGARVLLLSTDPELVGQVRGRATEPDAVRLNARLLPGWRRLPLDDDSVGATAVASGDGAPRLHDCRAVASELARVTADSGTVAVTIEGYRDRRRARAMTRALVEAGFVADASLSLVKVGGSLRVASRRGDLSSTGRLLAWLGRGASIRRKGFRMAASFLDRTGLLPVFLSRNRLLLFRKGEGAGKRKEAEGGNGAGQRKEGDSVLWPPPYLRSVLEEAGLDPERYRCGFHVHGRYDSNKVAFFLFDRERDGEPAHVVKATRAARFNYRLENEHRSLRLVEEQGLLPTDAIPRSTVLAYRGGLAMLGLEFVPGRPMREVTRGESDCARVARVVHHLQTLAMRSAVREPDGAHALRSGLGFLHRRFREIYGMPSGPADVLEEQVRALQDHADELPLVFQHGDAGIWNVMAGRGEAVLLDWEAGEPAGMPLWDLFYFLRSVGSWNSRVRGRADLIESYEEHFLKDSPLGRYRVREVERYRHGLGIAPGLVDPLEHTCWMHRAVREAMQMEPREVRSGTYYRLLLRSLEIRGRSGRGTS